MRVLIVTQYFFPEEFRINEIATELVKRGHKVEVVTGLPNYPKGEIYSGYENLFEEDYYGVKIHRTKIRPRHTGTLNLFLNYVSFMVKGKKTIKKLQKKEFDIIFSYQLSPVFQIVPAIFAKKIFGCKLVCMCCDQWPESLKARGLKLGLAFMIIGHQCKRIYNKCDFIINTSPSFITYNNVVNHVPLEKMDWHQQHSEDNFCGVSTENSTLKKGVDLLFAGNIGKVQNVEDIILAYNLLKYDDLKIHIFGDGSNYISCKELTIKLNIEKNVIFYGRVSEKELTDHYKNCDACLLTLSGKSAIGNTIPSKLQRYMSAGKTVLAAINGDAQKIIDDAKCGMYVKADDYRELAKLFEYYYNNKNKFGNCGKNARHYFENNCKLNIFIEYLEGVFKKQAN